MVAETTDLRSEGQQGRAFVEVAFPVYLYNCRSVLTSVT